MIFFFNNAEYFCGLFCCKCIEIVRKENVFGLTTTLAIRLRAYFLLRSEIQLAKECSKFAIN